MQAVDKLAAKNRKVIPFPSASWHFSHTFKMSLWYDIDLSSLGLNQKRYKSLKETAKSSEAFHSHEYIYIYIYMSL